MKRILSISVTLNVLFLVFALYVYHLNPFLSESIISKIKHAGVVQWNGVNVKLIGDITAYESNDILYIKKTDPIIKGLITIEKHSGIEANDCAASTLINGQKPELVEFSGEKALKTKYYKKDKLILTFLICSKKISVSYVGEEEYFKTLRLILDYISFKE